MRQQARLGSGVGSSQSQAAAHLPHIEGGACPAAASRVQYLFRCPSIARTRSCLVALLSTMAHDVGLIDGSPIHQPHCSAAECSGMLAEAMPLVKQVDMPHQQTMTTSFCECDSDIVQVHAQRKKRKAPSRMKRTTRTKCWYEARGRPQHRTTMSPRLEECGIECNKRHMASACLQTVLKCNGARWQCMGPFLPNGSPNVRGGLINRPMRAAPKMMSVEALGPHVSS